LFVDEASETEFEQAQTATKPQGHRDLLELIKLNSTIQKADPHEGATEGFAHVHQESHRGLGRLAFQSPPSPAMMVFVNDALNWPTKPVAVLREFLILLQPFPRISPKSFGANSIRSLP
jgi:hypothetical protein